MSHVLVVDNDSVTVEAFLHFLRTDGHQYSAAVNGRDAIQIASSVAPDVAVIHHELPDLPGHEVVSAIRSCSPRTRCVTLTSRWTLEVEFASKESGACACVRKPLVANDIIEIVDRALRPTRVPDRSPVRSALLALEEAQPHATLRIVNKIVQFVASPDDEPTLHGFGRRVGISRGGFRNWCQTSSLKAKAVLGFARGLRAAYRHQQDPRQMAEELLMIIDERTLTKFLLRSGGSSRRLPATVEIFLKQQRFIEKPDFVIAARSALRDYGLI